MKIRIKFRKFGVMRFIGHLDLMRYFQKAMRRAEIDIAYSEGFSPHQIMSFASPLGVGITSDGEYLDVEVHSTRSSLQSLNALNQAMVEGIEVIEYKRLPEGAKNAMSQVAAAAYTVHFKDMKQNPFSLQALSEALQGFYQGQKEILVTKQTKKSEKVMDLKPLIFQLEAVCVNETHKNPGFYMKLSSGSAENVKPELVLEAFFRYWTKQERSQSDGEARDYFQVQASATGDEDLQKAYDLLDFQIHRLEIYAQGADGAFEPLGDIGEDIL